MGLSTAFFLACRGIRPIVLEQRQTTGLHPRANTSPRTVELFRAAGLGDALEESGWHPTHPYGVVYRRSAVGPAISRGRPPAPALHRLLTCSPAPRTMVTSDKLERLLLEEVRARGGEIRFGLRLTQVSEEREGVRVTAEDTSTGERIPIEAAYLVGADGAHSTVRGELGLAMPDIEKVGAVHTAFCRADLGDRRDREARFTFVRNDTVYAALGALDGEDLWVCHIMDYPGKPDEPVHLPPDRTRELLQAAIGDPGVPVELLAANPWQAHLGLASAFRSGRVFLAGDAAHVQTSAGGLGMNTGIQDGHNLAWKLAAVLDGQAAPTLLDSYEPERRAAARLSVEYSRAMSRSVGIGASQGEEPEYVRDNRAHDLLRAMMFYGYDSDAVVLDEDDPLPAEADPFEDVARPGYRFPHYWLTSGERCVSTAELTGYDWLLLTGAKGQPWLTAAASLDVPAVRAHRVVGAEENRVAEGSATLGDPEGSFPSVAGVEPDGAVLVRPDGFVCWRSSSLGDASAEKALLRVFRRVLRCGADVSRRR